MLSLFIYCLIIAIYICFGLFMAFICRSKYVYRFIYIYYVLVNIYCVVIIPFPCVLVQQSRVALVNYVSPL